MAYRTQRTSPAGKFGRLLQQKQPIQDRERAERAILEFLPSKKRGLMLTGERYYRGDHDILRRKRWVIGENGLPKEDRTLYNNRLAHAFLRKLTDQKCQYLFGKPFTVQAENALYRRRLESLFDNAFRNRIKNLCREAVNKGIGWLQVYIEGGQLKFMRIPAEQVIPFWKDMEHTELEAVIRVYKTTEERGRETEEVTRAEYWQKDGVSFWILKGKKLCPDPQRRPQSHLTLDGKPYNFGELPFIAFKYNEEEQPLAAFCKDLVDDYDLLQSDDSNTLCDSPNAIMVLTNYDGEDLGEFRRNLSQYKAVKVTDGGGLEVKSAAVQTGAVGAHLERLRRDIYEIGRGVDTRAENFGNLSGVGLKFLYADLDLDCSGIETEFAAGFEKLLGFVKSWLFLTGQGDFREETAQIILNRDILINESEAIADCAASGEILSRQTILENHPWVRNVSEELKKLAPGEGETAFNA